MPMAMKLAKPEKTAWQYNYHIDWDAPVTEPLTREHSAVTAFSNHR